MNEIVEDHLKALKAVNVVKLFVEKYFISGYDTTELEIIKEAIIDDLTDQGVFE